LTLTFFEGVYLLANIKSAKKRVIQAETRRKRNVHQRSAMRTQVKTLLEVIKTGDAAAANEVFKKTASILDRSARKGLIHQNKAARTKSRLNKKIKALVFKDKDQTSQTTAI
jgi:small subunit ribosomal protein S20